MSGELRLTADRLFSDHAMVVGALGASWVEREAREAAKPQVRFSDLHPLYRSLGSAEPIRPAVDAFVLDLLEERILTSHDFAELPNGICRVRAPLTHELALTLGRWRLLLAPVVTHLAQVFRAALLSRVETNATRPRKAETGRTMRRESLESPRANRETPEIPRTNGRFAYHCDKSGPCLPGPARSSASIGVRALIPSTRGVPL